MKKLNIIIKDLSIVKDDVAKLIKYDGDKRKKVNTTIQKETINEEKEILLAKVILARSVCDLEMAGFMYSMEKINSCSVCKVGQSDDNFSFYGIFSYDHFSDNEKLPDIFRNLKKHVKSHLKISKIHINNLNLELEKQNEEKRRKGKNYEAGMNLGRLSMKLYLMGRPYTDYEYDVLNLKQNQN